MKRVISAICAVLFCTSLILGNLPAAHADPMTTAMFGTAAYAYAQASGLTWIFGNGSTSGTASTWIENQVNSWLDGRDLTQVIGSAVLRAEVGKLIVPYQIGIAIADFINDLIDKHDITPDNVAELSPGEIDGYPLSSISRNYTYGNDPQTSGLEVVSPNNIPFSISGTWYSGGVLKVYYNRQMVWSLNIPTYYTYFYGWYPYVKNGVVYFRFLGNQSTNGEKEQSRVDFTRESSINVPVNAITGQIQVSMQSDFELPDFPDVGYQWEGTIDGSTPDTNLDQLIGIIDQNIADNNLDVEGEVVNPIDPPVPPTPAPIEPDTPLQDVPWEGLNDLLDNTNSTLDSIDNEIINAGQGIDNISGELDNIGTQIGEQTTSISGALEQATADTVEAIEGTTAAVNDITDILSPQEVEEKTFDLRNLFPFCIPFDIYHLLQKFDATPVAPHVQIPIVISSIGFSYTMDLDFSSWDPVAAAMRTVELIVYALGLAWATSKVIKW